MSEILKQLYLKYWKGYRNEQAYWNSRWSLGLENERLTTDYQARLAEKICKLMDQYGCSSFLDVGCGEAKLRDIPGYLGLDFSLEAIKKNKLPQAIFADVTNGIPLPSKSVDMSFAMVVFLHIPPEKIEHAISEVCRVTEKCIYLIEPKYEKQAQYQKHCFSYDLESMIKKQFNGVLVLESPT